MYKFDDRFLLLMGCSDTKVGTLEFLEAWDMYAGPMYLDLQIQRKKLAVLPKILILSAGHGLIDCRHEIARYDRRMTPKVAYDIMTTKRHQASFDAAFDKAERVFCVAGRAYDDILQVWAGRRLYDREPGGIGMKRQAMVRFLGEVAATAA